MARFETAVTRSDPGRAWDEIHVTELPNLLGGKWRPIERGGLLVLMIDEAQMIRPGDPDVSQLSEILHGAGGRGSPLPIMAMYFGLSDTERRLREAVASRLPRGSVLDLSALPHADCERVVERFFDRYLPRTPAVQVSAWSSALAGESMGWPQHLTNSLRALAAACLETGHTPDAGDPAALVRVLDADRRTRVDYYQDRLEAATPWHPLAAPVLAALPEGGATEEATLMAMQAARSRRITAMAPGFERLDGRSVDDCLDAFVHAGVLSPFRGEDGVKRYGCPIPSLRTWILQHRSDGAMTSAGPSGPLSNGRASESEP